LGRSARAAAKCSPSEIARKEGTTLNKTDCKLFLIFLSGQNIAAGIKEDTCFG